MHRLHPPVCSVQVCLCVTCDQTCRLGAYVVNTICTIQNNIIEMINLVLLNAVSVQK